MASDKAEALQHFIDDFVKERSDHYFIKIKQYFDDNEKEIAAEFCHSFQELYNRIPEDLSGKVPVSYIHYSMLLSHVLLGEPAYRAEAYGAAYYCEEPIASVDYHPKWLIDFLYEFYEELKAEAKRYMFHVNEIEVEKLFLIEVKNYEGLMYEVTRDAMKEIFKCQEFKNLKYEEQVEFRIGAFRGESNLFYIKDQDRDKKREKWYELLSNKPG